MAEKRELLNKDLYRKIKGMNRAEMESYLRDLHQEGYKDGVAASSKAVICNIQTALMKTKGIGEKRCEDIMTNIVEEIKRNSA